MTNINVCKDSDRFEFIQSVLGNSHMTVFKDGKEIALWYVSPEDKKALEEMEMEELNV